MTNRERLTQVDGLLTEILASLDDSTSTCECCERETYNTYEDHCIAERFITTRKKWRRLLKDKRTDAWLERS